MPEYRLYRLSATNRIMGPAVEVEESNDAAAIGKAIAIDHAHIIEVWSGARLVSKVDTEQKRTSAV